MKLLNGAQYIYTVRTNRILTIGGRYGSGKTLVSYITALELVRMGYARHVVSNIPDVVSTPLEDLKLERGKSIDAVMILDEGGEFLDSIKDARTLMFALRKMNLYIICPGVTEPPPRMRAVRLARLIDWSVIGLPLWWYRYKIRSSGDEYGLGVLNYRSVYGVYDTKAIPADEAGFYTFAEEARRVYSKEKGTVYRSRKRGGVTGGGVTEVIEGGGMAEDMGVQAEELEDTVSNMERAVKALSATRRKKYTL